MPGHELPAPPPVETLAPALADFVTALHAFPVERARTLRVPEDDDDARDYARSALEHWPEVAPLLAEPERRRVEASLREAAEAAPSPRPTLRLVHADLLAEHVLVDPATGSSNRKASPTRRAK